MKTIYYFNVDPDTGEVEPDSDLKNAKVETETDTRYMLTTGAVLSKISEFRRIFEDKEEAYMEYIISLDQARGHHMKQYFACLKKLRENGFSTKGRRAKLYKISKKGNSAVLSASKASSFLKCSSSTQVAQAALRHGKIRGYTVEKIDGKVWPEEFRALIKRVEERRSATG